MYKVKEMIFISPLRKNTVRYSVYIGLFTAAFIIFLLPNFLIDRTQKILTKDARFPTDLKYILFWKPLRDKKATKFHHQVFHQHPSGQSAFIKQKCHFINCYITYKEHLLWRDHKNFDAVVFSVQDLIKLRPKDVNLTRSPYQKYIFHSLESATEHPICNPAFDGFFNWTWTYKLDSDIVHPFFDIYDADYQLTGPAKNITWIADMKHGDKFTEKIRKKTKAVAVIINKCSLKTKYLEFIKDLLQELHGYNYTLDLYGPCGDIKCSNKRLSECYKFIESRYFFELVLEDSIADDYVTEKIEKAMTHVIIPIVLGGLDYNSFMPPGSYIDSQQLSIKKLGAIIDYLIRNPETYGYFFDWKNYYFYTPKSRSFLCDLCSKLNLNDSVSHKEYHKFRKWWNPNYKDDCRRLRSDHKLSNRDYSD